MLTYLYGVDIQHNCTYALFIMLFMHYIKTLILKTKHYCIIKLSEMKNIASRYEDNIPNEDYHAGPELSSSKLETVAYQSIAHLYKPRKETQPKNFGTLLHTILLEPHLVDEIYVENNEPAPVRRGKTEVFWRQYCAANGLDPEDKKTISSDEWKIRWFSWANPGKIQITNEEKRIINGIKSSVDNHPTLRKIIEGGVRERSFYWEEEFEVDGETITIPMKCRPDIFLDDEIIIFDLKSTTDASEYGFSKEIANFKYHWKAAFYCRGIEKVLGERVKRFIWIPAEKEFPFGVTTQYMPDDMREDAEETLDVILNRYAYQLKHKDHYLKHPYPTGMIPAQSKNYMKYERYNIVEN